MDHHFQSKKYRFPPLFTEQEYPAAVELGIPGFRAGHISFI
jgi:hypothetical protein